MKYLRIYDLRNERVTIIPYSRNVRSAYCRRIYSLEMEKLRKKRRNRLILKWIKRKMINALIALFKISASLAAGLVFMNQISKWLRVVRGYDAIGSEIFAAGIISALVFLFLDWFFWRIGEYLWRKK